MRQSIYERNEWNHVTVTLKYRNQLFMVATSSELYMSRPNRYTYRCNQCISSTFVLCRCYQYTLLQVYSLCGYYSWLYLIFMCYHYTWLLGMLYGQVLPENLAVLYTICAGATSTWLFCREQWWLICR